MTKLLTSLCRRTDGASALEFALVAPIILMMLFGSWNAGVMLFAQNGIRNAVETGARHATIYPRPSETQIRQVADQAYYGPSQGTLTSPQLAYAMQNGAPVVTISMTYTHQTFVPFLSLPPVTLSHQRTAYLAPEANP